MNRPRTVKIVTGASLLGFAVVLLVAADWGIGGAIAGIVAAVAAILTLAVQVRADLARPKSVEALLSETANTIELQWLQEIGSRKLRDSPLLPFTWSDGEIAGDFDDCLRQLNAEYRGVTSGRLVILGQPGCGKTSLAMMICLALLRNRKPDQSVPVLLPAGSWDPIQTSLEAWLVESMATTHYNISADIARALWRDHKLLPILDGIDEIGQEARRVAIERINEAGVENRPLVLTCRDTDYRDLVTDGSPTLRAAPVIRLLPLRPTDVINHLAKAEGDWSQVCAEIQEHPDGVVASVFSTPLMVVMARNAHQHGALRLADLTGFPTRHAAESHIIEHVIDAAYLDNPGRWYPEAGRRWLRFLAQHLHRQQTRDILWWQLANGVPSAVAPLIGLALGLAALVVCVAGAPLITSGQSSGGDTAVSVGLVTGLVVAAGSMILWFTNRNQVPLRVTLVRSGSGHRFWRGFRTGFLLLALPSVLLLTGWGISAFLVEGGKFGSVRSFVEIAVTTVGLGIALGCGVGVHNWLAADSARSTQTTPLDSFRNDRTSAWLGSFTAAVVVGLLAWPMYGVCSFVGEIVGTVVAGQFGGSGRPLFSPFGNPERLDVALMVALTVVLPGVVVFALVLCTRAWSRFVVARLAFALTRRLPIRLLSFLLDARDRGMLRQVGSGLQFRHRHVQEHLVNPGPESAAGPVRRVPRSVVVVATAFAVVATGVVTLIGYNHIRCEPDSFFLGAETTQARVYSAGETMCVGVVSTPEWRELARRDSVFDTIAESNEAAVKDTAHTTIAVLLSLGTRPDLGLREADRHTVHGVAIAQLEAARLAMPFEVVLVNTGHPRADSDLSYYYMDDLLEELLQSWQARYHDIRAVITNGSLPSYPKLPVVRPAKQGDEFWFHDLAEFTVHQYAMKAQGKSQFKYIGHPDGPMSSCYDGAIPELSLRQDGARFGRSAVTCGDNIAIASDSETADTLRQHDPKEFVGFTLFYCVFNPSEVRKTTDVSPEFAATPASGLMYRVALNAAGIMDFDIMRLDATPTGWQTSEVPYRRKS